MARVTDFGQGQNEWDDEDSPESAHSPGTQDITTSKRI